MLLHQTFFAVPSGAKRFKFHRFQHVYAWFFYGLMTLSWCTAKDFIQAKEFQRDDLLKTQSQSDLRQFLNAYYSKGHKF
jgi:linoleoyl-CoA desaturase